MAESMVAGSSLLDSGRIQWQETNRNFYQTLNKVRIQQGVPPVNHHSDPIGKLLNDRTVFVKIRNERYPISCEILDSIFSGFGILIGINRLSSGFHSTVRFVEKELTIRAFESLNGRNIYDDRCKLELFLVTTVESSCSKQENATLEESVTLEEMEDIEVAYPSQELVEDFDWQEIVGKPKVSNDEFTLIPNPIEVECVAEEITDPIEGLYHEIDIASISKSSSLQQSEDEVLGNLIVQPESSTAEDLTKASELENKDDIDESQIQSNRLEVNTNSCDVVIFDGAVKELAKLVEILIEWIEIKLANSREFSLRMSSFDCLRSFDAHKVFDKMSRKGVHVMTLLRVGDCLSNLVGFGGELKQHSITLPYDRGKEMSRSCCWDISKGCWSADLETDSGMGFVFDPGILG